MYNANTLVFVYLMYMYKYTCSILFTFISSTSTM